jgi:hypothetical protein
MKSHPELQALNRFHLPVIIGDIHGMQLPIEMSIKKVLPFPLIPKLKNNNGWK